MDRHASRTVVRDALLATALALILTAAWVLRDWSNLWALRLPDTDDAMRLQQIRDWIAGQGFADLEQHRLGLPPGLEMHWSRLPDLVPAAIIVAVTPLAGAHAAEVAAVVVWPALLFAAALALVASIARSLGASGPIAAVIAALAYPATTLFVPGRIDHHGFQLVLILVLVRALLSGSRTAGAVAGVATAVSLAIGLETAPLLVVGAGAALLSWIAGRPGAQARLGGYGIALTLSLAVAAGLLRTSGWGWAGCDGFTAELWRAAQIAALAPLLLAAAGAKLAGARARMIAALVVGVAVSALALAISPGCLRPYGAVDPQLARLWLAHVAEAQPLFAAPAGNAIGYSGLAIVGLAVTGWAAWRTRADGWLLLLAFELAAFAVTLVQLRGAYAGALLAAPALSALIAAARVRGTPALAAGWIVSAGLVYPMLGGMLASKPGGGGVVADCTTPQALARIATLPPGRLIASVDLGAFALAAGPHQLIAAPYHRNTQGNRVMYAFFLGPAAQSESLARQWGVDYVALCPGDFDELGAIADNPGHLAGALRAGRVPAWLRPISRPGEAPGLYALRGRD